MNVTRHGPSYGCGARTLLEYNMHTFIVDVAMIVSKQAAPDGRCWQKGPKSDPGVQLALPDEPIIAIPFSPRPFRLGRVLAKRDGAVADFVELTSQDCSAVASTVYCGLDKKRYVPFRRFLLMLLDRAPLQCEGDVGLRRTVHALVPAWYLYPYPRT